MMSGVSDLNFGRIALTERLESLLNMMNGHVWSVCAALPRPIRDSAVLWLQKHYAGFHPQDTRTFLLRFFHPPAWTILEHLNREKKLPDESLFPLLQAQASAMVVHMLDDHIVDGQVQLSHLVLHLRTAYWTHFSETLNIFQTRLSPERNVSGECIDAYLSGIHGTKTPETGEQYREEFLKQASTWFIAPMLAAGGDRQDDVKRIYENFALAWRILDDARDAQGDAASGAGTAVYFALNEEHRKAWKQKSPEIMNIVHESGTMEALLSEIRGRLALAAADARRLNLEELALEYEALARLRNGDDPL